MMPCNQAFHWINLRIFMMLNEIISRLPDGRAENDLARYLNTLSERERVILVETLLNSDVDSLNGVGFRIIPRVIRDREILIKFLNLGLEKKYISGIKPWIKASVSGLGYKRLLQHLLKVAETNPDWIVYAWYQLVPLIKKEAPEQIQYLQEIEKIVDDYLCNELQDFWLRNKQAVPI